MIFTKRMLFFGVVFSLAIGSVFGETEIKGRLLKATRNGTNITGSFEPIVSIFQDAISGVRSIKIHLSGSRPRDSKIYEFYHDGTTGSPIIWKRRMRGVLVQPIAVYITTTELEDGSNLLYFNYEYREKKGFGSVDYIIEVKN